MSFSMGSSYLLHSHFPSFASSSSQPVSFHVKNSNNNAMTERKRVVSACMGQENPKEIVFSKKRTILFLGISILPFLQLRARALEGLVTKRRNLGGEERRKWIETRGTESGETKKLHSRHQRRTKKKS
uniref:Uncharacterized protein n=1 Tax=Salix viminalis TaxID=40686 RepID=A0A6N2KH98_SALVM